MMELGILVNGPHFYQPELAVFAKKAIFCPQTVKQGGFLVKRSFESKTPKSVQKNQRKKSGFWLVDNAEGEEV